MRPQRSVGDGEWGAHIRHQANASPSDQSRHENSSAELPRFSHDNAEKERVYTPSINRNILSTRDWHFALSYTSFSQDVAAYTSARPGALGCAGWVLPLLLLLLLLFLLCLPLLCLPTSLSLGYSLPYLWGSYRLSDWFNGPRRLILLIYLQVNILNIYLSIFILIKTFLILLMLKWITI